MRQAICSSRIRINMAVSMTANTVSLLTSVSEALVRAARFRLRDRLFLASALLSTAILLIAAWVINNQVVRQARQHVLTEIEDLLPVYDSVWEENARSLSTLGLTMANSQNVKIIFGDARARRDRETIKEMIADFGGDLDSPICAGTKPLWSPSSPPPAQSLSASNNARVLRSSGESCFRSPSRLSSFNPAAMIIRTHSPCCAPGSNSVVS